MKFYTEDEALDKYGIKEHRMGIAFHKSKWKVLLWRLWDESKMAVPSLRFASKLSTAICFFAFSPEKHDFLP